MEPLRRVGSLSLSTSTPPPALWTPPNVEATAMDAFRRWVNTRHGLALGAAGPADYAALWEWSVTEIADFWSDVWTYTRIIASVPYHSVLEADKAMHEVPRWFDGARLNLAENLLWPNDDHTAVISTGEGHAVARLSYRDLRTRVGECAAALRAVGVVPLDRVTGYVSNCVEAVVMMLATASIGAIWSSTSPDFGVTGVLERFSQIQPKVILSVNAVHYNGRVHDHLHKLQQVVEGLAGLETVILLPFVADHSVDRTKIPHAILYADFLERGRRADGTFPPLEFEQVPFDHPAYILFSSGTTGHPKCLVHSVGGPLLQHKKEHVLHGDLKREDVVFQYTTTGWMMWNWLLGVLSVGATIVLFDGSPFKPDPLRIWHLVDELGVTVFGTSAKYLAALEEAHIEPGKHAPLATLRAIYSTGSPLKPESYDYVYEHIKGNVMLASITGGTDIVSLFAGHNTALPVYRGEVQCRCLGMKIESWNSDGQPVVGEEGDLVCTKPFPCMPVYFWNDHDGAKYRKSYFAEYNNVWYHGDFLVINPATGGLVMLGRSDGTLNPGGVRFGSAEIYNVLAKETDVADSLVVGQKQGNDERVVLFVTLAPGASFTPALEERIRKLIRSELTPRHVPAVILPIAEIPYTINGKKVEVAIKRILSGEPVVASGTLANPAVLDLYRNLPQLQLPQ